MNLLVVNVMLGKVVFFFGFCENGSKDENYDINDF